VAEIEYTKNLQSPAQFQRGDSLTVRGGTVTELLAALAEAKSKPEFAEFFGGTPDAVVKAADWGFEVGHAAATIAANVKIEDVTDEAKPPSDIEALENLKNVLGATPVEKPASPAQIAVAAKKSGKSVSELQGISEAAAKELIKKGAA
jgi:hypothetical protein